MKKSVRSLLIMLAVLVVVGGAAALLLLLPTGATEEDASSAAVSQEERQSLLEVDAADVSAIKVENSQDSFTILPVTVQPEESSASSDTGGTSASGPETSYTIEGLEDYDVNTSTLENAAETLLSTTVNRALGPQDGLEKYGLAGEGAVQITIETKSGGSTTLALGITNTSGTTGQYVLKDNEVYLVPALPDLFSGRGLDCVSCDVYSIPSWTISGAEESGESSAVTESIPDTLLSASLSGKAFPQPIQIEYVAKSRLNGYMLTAPVTAVADTAAADALTAALKDLVANSVAAVGVTEGELAQYGLDQPDAAVTFTLNQAEEMTLRASAKDADGSRYLMLDGRDVVYKVDNSRISAWAEAQAMDLRTGTICLANIADVERLALTRDGDMVYDFEVDLEAEETTVKKPDGEDVAYEDYQAFFQQLTGLSVFSLEEAPCEGAPALRVEYQYKNGTSDVVEFFPVEGQDRYAAALNGEFNGLVRGSEVNALVGRLDEVFGYKTVD